MKRYATRRRLLVRLAALPALLATGCTGAGAVDVGKACTAMGASSGVAVKWKTADFTGSAKGISDEEFRSGPLVARLCVRQTCESGTVAHGDDPAPFMRVKLKEGMGEVTVPVRFAVTWRGDGERVLFDGRTDVELKKFQPNGAGCAPTVFTAGLIADPKRGLVAHGRS